MANYNQIPERLEVSEGGFTSIMWKIELIYWKYDNTNYIYGLVYEPKLWIFLMIAMLLSSAYFYLQSLLHRNSDGIGNLALKAVGTNLKALVAMDLDTHTQMSLRIHILSISLCGALLFWSYSGSLVSYFTAESEKIPFESLEDLADLPQLKLAVLKDTASHQKLIRELKKNPELEEAISKNIKYYEALDVAMRDFKLSHGRHGQANHVFFGLIDEALIYFWDGKH